MSIELSSIERSLLSELGLSIKPSVQKKVSAKEFKIIKARTKCKLCGSCSLQIIQMVKVDDCWVKNRELPLSSGCEQNYSYEEYQTEVRRCWKCEEVLLRKDKTEFVQMIINLFNAIVSRQEIWKHIK